MHKIRRTVTAAVLAVGVLGTSFVSASQATAGTTATRNLVCEHGEVCLYKDGRVILDDWPTFPGNCTRISQAYTYLRNKSGINQRAWSGDNCTGRFVDVPPNGESAINLFWSLGG